MSEQNKNTTVLGGGGAKKQNNKNQPKKNNKKKLEDDDDALAAVMAEIEGEQSGKPVQKQTQPAQQPQNSTENSSVNSTEQQNGGTTTTTTTDDTKSTPSNDTKQQPAQQQNQNNKKQNQKKKKLEDDDDALAAVMAEIEGEQTGKPAQPTQQQQQAKPANAKQGNAKQPPPNAGAKKGGAAKENSTPTTSTPPASSAKEAAPAPSAKKGGAAKKKGVAAKILAMQAEREKQEREEKEREQREKEEEERRIAEAKKAEEERIKLAQVKKEQQKKQSEQQKKDAAEKKRLEILARFAQGPGVIVAGLTKGPGAPQPATTGGAPAGGAAKKKPFNKKGGKGGKGGAQGTNDTSQQPQVASEGTENKQDATTESAQPVVATTPAVQPAESWEDEETEETSTTSGKEVSSSSDSTPAPTVDQTAATPSADQTKPSPTSSGTSTPLSSSASSATSSATTATTTTTSTDATGEEKEKELAPGEKLRSPICCVLGHVDTGKTKLLDKMRNTNVQDGEVGGITQQIGATYFPMEKIKDLTQKLNQRYRLSYLVPGLLIIDTPGHESFTNLRTRGSSLCDIAILVVDIMHGLEPQTIESINLLKMRNTPFVVALNKVDRLYGWRAIKGSSIQEALKKQDNNVMMEYEDRVNFVIGQFAEQSLNAVLYYKAKKLKDFQKNVSLVPCSAISGEGIPDLLLLLVQLTQKLMGERLVLKEGLQCTVLEVKVLEGLGTTIDVILANGSLHEGDEILLCGLNGPIRTSIRSLLTPPPLRELRVKNQYIHHKEVHAALGVKIAAHNLEGAIAGSQLLVIKDGDDVEAMEARVMEQLRVIKEKVGKAKHGVYVQASTLGSLEALLEFLSKDCKIPVAGFGIGPVHKRDVMTASVMLDKAPEYACILAFDVKMANDAREFAEKSKVKVFEADIIYHLEDMFKKYLEELQEKSRVKAKSEAVFPCVLQILPEYIFRVRDPIVVGVKVKEGILKVGTPIVVLKPDGHLELGKITSIEKEHKQYEEAKEGDEVAVNIQQEDGRQLYMYGRQFDEKDDLVSKISRNSLDALKSHYTDVCKEHFKLLKKLKKVFLDE